MSEARDILAARIQPRFLTREDAARYVGVSPGLFDAEVAAGMWPGPLRRGTKAGRLTWDIRALDAAADQRSGLVDRSGQAMATVHGTVPLDAAVDEEWDRRIRHGAAQKQHAG